MSKYLGGQHCTCVSRIESMWPFPISYGDILWDVHLHTLLLLVYASGYYNIYI